MRVLGVDPGLQITGYGCLSPSGASRGRDTRVIEAGVLRLNTRFAVADRLVELDADFRELLGRVRPDVVAVEMLFAHYKHPATAIVMGHARGVLLLAARQASIPIVELRPTEVKKSLTGHGHAKKDQMQRAIQVELGLKSVPQPADVADAMAIALCAIRRNQAGEIICESLEAAIRGVKG